MEIPAIKDKMTARAFAIYAVMKTPFDIYSETGEPIHDTVKAAKMIEKYIIGDAKLPEVVEDPNMKILDMWNKIKESSEKSQRDTPEPIKEPCPELATKINNRNYIK